MTEGCLVRYTTSDHGTQGYFISPGFSCHTMEPPWRDNQRNISCIPAGEYDVVIAQSPKYGLVYWVKDVPDRDLIRIHSGNLGGDVKKGLVSHTKGCLLFGLEAGLLLGQRAVLNSKWAIDDFTRYMDYKSFKLKIVGGEQWV